MPASDQTLTIAAFNGGFFANFNNVMSVLHERRRTADSRPVHIDWTVRADFTDFRYAPVGTNAWPNYFAPLDPAPAPEQRVTMKTFPDWSITHVQAYWLYRHNLNPGWRERYHDLYRTHIRLQPAIVRRVAEIRALGLEDRFVVGAHVRHPGHSIENPFPIPPVGAFISEIRKRLDAHPDGMVFLATDYTPAAAAFREAFGLKLVMQPDVVRSAGTAQSHIAAPHVGQAMGEQVLADCLVLAASDVMVHVNSNVATAAGYMNPAMTMVYCESRLRYVAGMAMGKLAGGRIPLLRRYSRLLRRMRAQ